MAQQDEPEIPEQGDIHFAYRPKVRPADEEHDENAAEGVDEAENFYLVLKPEGGRFRLINIGRKRVPDIDGHERNWGFVDTVAGSGKAIEEALQRETYETKTRGERLRPARGRRGRGLRPGARGQQDLPRLDAGAAGPAGPGAGGVQHSQGGHSRGLDQEPREGRRAAGRAAPRRADARLSGRAAGGFRGPQVRRRGGAGPLQQVSAVAAGEQ
jgi:hypothetical protein